MRAYDSCLLFALVTAVLIPNSAEAQVTDVDCLALFDSDGTRIARSITTNTSNVFFSKAHNGFPVLLHYIDNGFHGFGGSLYFTDANCSSTSFMRFSSDLIFPSVLIDQDVYYSDPAAVPQNVQVLSYLSEYGSSCQPINSFLDAYPVIGQFTLPQYTPPFHFEPEPCFTPPDPDPDQIINACMKNRGGALRIVEDPVDCTQRETPITLLSP